jgi:hypothetical protein
MGKIVLILFIVLISSHFFTTNICNADAGENIKIIKDITPTPPPWVLM